MSADSKETLPECNCTSGHYEGTCRLHGFFQGVRQLDKALAAANAAVTDDMHGAALASPDVDSMWQRALTAIMADGVKVGSRDGGTTEVLDRTFAIADPTACVLQEPARRMRPDYMGAELLWYLSGEDETEVMEAFAPHYERFAQDEQRGDPCAVGKRTCWGAYGARIAGRGSWRRRTDLQDTLDERGLFTGYDQLSLAVRLLCEKRESRQAVVQLWRPSDLAQSVAGGIRDVPCTAALHFLVRDGRLRMTVWMRSSDAWLGLPNDVFALCSIQCLVAMAVGKLGEGQAVHPGRATFHMTSLHVYDRDWDKAQSAITQKPPASGRIDVSKDSADFMARGARLFDLLRATVRAGAESRPAASGLNDKAGWPAFNTFLGQCYGSALRRLMPADDDLKRAVLAGALGGAWRAREAGGSC